MLLKVLLFLIAFLVGADELMLGPLLAPIGAELGVAPERVTLFITAYSVALALIAPLLGGLSDRHGRLRVMLPASLLFGAASVATGLVANFEVGLATRVITGLASAGMLPIAFAMAADGAPADAMKRIAWVQSGLTLGMISSPAVGALLAQLSSWRTPSSCSASAPGPWRRPWPGSRRARRRLMRAARTPRRRARCWPFRGTRCPSRHGVGAGGGIGLFNLVGQHLHDSQGLPVWSVGLLYGALGVISVVGNVLMPRLAGYVKSGRP